MAAIRNASWLTREAQRERGQFWTPDWVADAMVTYAIAGGAKEIFDPAVGAGAFFRAALRISGSDIRLGGYELDAGALVSARESGLSGNHLTHVRAADFVLDPPSGPFAAMVANPPYIRHHRIAPRAKTELRAFSTSLLGGPLDGRAGYHFYFFLRALSLLAAGGRLAFILPADVCEGVSAPRLWRWIAGHFCLDGVVRFAPEAAPFPGVDTNPLVVFLRREPPQRDLHWAVCRVPGRALAHWVAAGFGADVAGVDAGSRDLAEAVQTGLSRPAQAEPDPAGDFRLGHFARVMRGIATGCNNFFFLTSRRAGELEILPEFLLPAVGRTRDVEGGQFAPADLARLQAGGRPTLLFAPDGRALADFPAPVRRYLQSGSRLGLPLRPLLSQRRPWYRMERRQPPPFLFAYLGRRNLRFVRNTAGVVPLTCLLCVYPRLSHPEFLSALGAALSDPETLAGLALVGKTYGGGAIKVEPRALERLPLPGRIAERLGLMLPPARRQADLPFGVKRPLREGDF